GFAFPGLAERGLSRGPKHSRPPDVCHGMPGCPVGGPMEVAMARRISPGLLVLVFALSVPLFGAQGLTLPPSGDNPRASVTQAIGPVRVTIDYSSPHVVRGKNDRKGKIWGELVPWGMSDLGFNGCASCPWRAGANENTTFAVTHAVKVQGQELAAGTYGLLMIPGQDEWTVIF